MYKKHLQKIIENDNEIFCTGGIGNDEINKIEKMLNVKLPKSYRWFLENYGMLIGYGVEIIGCGQAGEPAVVKETQRYRMLGMPNQYIVIRSLDEWVECLKISIDNNEDNEVITWDRVSKKEHEKNKNFYQYLVECLQEGKELWEEDF